MSFRSYVQISLPPSPTKFENYWMKVESFWLSFSKKFDFKSPQFLIPLQIQNLDSGEKDTQRQNSLLLETSDVSGAQRIYIASTNRIEIIKIYLTLQDGQKKFNLALLDHSERCAPAIDVEYDVFSGFMNMNKQKQTLHATPQILSLLTDQQSGQQQSAKGVVSINVRDVISISAKQNDGNCPHRLIIAAREEGAQDVVRELNVPEATQMERLIAYILFSVTCQK